MTPRVIVACRRLGLLSKMVCYAQCAILFMALAAASKGGQCWMTRVLEDCSLLGTLEGFDQFQNLDEIGKVLRFLKSQGVRKFRDTLKQVLKQKRAYMQHVWGFRPSGWGQTTSNGTKCEICGAIFKNICVLIGRMYDKHGVRDVIRQKIEGTSCGVHMYEFGSRERLLRHLQAKGFCYVGILL